MFHTCEINKYKYTYRINKFQTLYKASDHNYSHESFHKLCDGKSPTITIIESNHGNIFGGYTPIPWSSDNMYHSWNGESFLFSLSSYQQQRPKLKTWNHKQYWEVIHRPYYALTFVVGHDLKITDKCNKTDNTCCGRGYLEMSEGQEFCGGDLKKLNIGIFTVNDYEVFEMK